MEQQYQQSIDQAKSKCSQQFFTNNEYQELKLNDNIIRVDQSISKDYFISKFEIPNKPVIISNLTDQWISNWTFDKLLNEFGDHEFKVGMDDDGNRVTLPFRIFYKYLQTNKDLNSLYLFDGQLTQQLLQKYQVPHLFEEDLFKFLEEKRPPFRWLLVGGKRSGSPIHIDPHSTSAWNSCLVGRKYWIMIPPDCEKKVAKGKIFANQLDKQDLECPYLFFQNVLPLLKTIRNDIIECVQQPGETMFVPGGWWHAVLNLDETIAVTQNFVSYQNFNNVWRAFRKESPSLSAQLLWKLPKELHNKATQLNKQDGFEMIKLEELQQINEENEEIEDLPEFVNKDYDMN